MDVPRGNPESYSTALVVLRGTSSSCPWIVELQSKICESLERDPQEAVSDVFAADQWNGAPVFKGGISAIPARILVAPVG